ncbi:hypothetical protein MACJ_001259 [Theileria orientalis]|uniref:Uncharacterized protein n=1 Tax=Theileria orientalis TaxID=68886 RepID=A0A976M9S4_THEOR|nr:hypothetical protein MACJ_001259 [Theileria orientalis]
MRDNTLILPQIVNLNSNPPRDIDSFFQHSTNDQFTSDLSSVDMYLVNKKCSTKYDIPQQNDPSIRNSAVKDSSIKDSFSRESLFRESAKRGYNAAFEAKIDDPSIKRRNFSSNINFSNTNNTSHNTNANINSSITTDTIAPCTCVGATPNSYLIDKITSVSTSNVKKIMDLLSKSTSIRDFQTQLQSLMFNLCTDLHKNNYQEIEHLNKRVDYLSDEKNLLTNIVKSQYESIKRMKDDESSILRIEEENVALKTELNKMRSIVNNLVYKNDSSDIINNYDYR